MIARCGLKRHGFRGGLAGLFAVQIASMMLLMGCGEITTTPLEPGVVEKGMVSLQIEPTAASVAPGKTLEIAVIATDVGGSPVKDGTTILLVCDSLGSISPATATTTNGTARAMFQAGAKIGTSTIIATNGRVTQSLDVRIETSAATTPPPYSGSDAIDPSTVTWLQGSPADFPVTATLSRINISSGEPKTITWSWTHPPWRGNIWGVESTSPEAVCGMMWVFARIDGRWYAKGWEWLRTDTSASTLENHPGQPPFIQAKAGPVDGWYPQPGEEVGFMVSTITAHWDGYTLGPPTGRSPIVKVRWP